MVSSRNLNVVAAYLRLDPFQIMQLQDVDVTEDLFGS